MQRPTVLFLFVASLASAPALYAADDASDWKSLTEGMSERQYKDAYRGNQRIIKQYLKSHSESILGSVGMPETGVRLVGVAAGMAASMATNHDMRFGLNQDRTMLMEFRDPAGDDQALFLRYRIKW